MLTVMPLSSASSPRRIIKYVTREGKSPIIRVRNLERSENYESYIDQFRSTMDFYGKFSSPTDKRCYHYSIGASPEDGVSPEEMMDITEEFVDRVFPGYEVVMALHEKETEGPHTHFVVNAVNMKTGMKMHLWKEGWMKAEETLNDISRERGIEERDLGKRNGSARSRSEVYITRRGESSWVSNVREAADEALRISSSEPEFVFRMAEKGFPVEIHSDPGEYLYHTPENSYTVRGRKLGADFTRSSVRERFLSGANPVPEPVVPLPADGDENGYAVTIWGAAPGDEVSYGELTEERFRLTEDWRRYATLFAYWGYDFWDLNEFCLFAERGDIIEWNFSEGLGSESQKMSAPKPEYLADVKLTAEESAYALGEMIPVRCSSAMDAAAAGEFAGHMDYLTKLFGLRVPVPCDAWKDSETGVSIFSAEESDTAKLKNAVWFCDKWLDYAQRSAASGRLVLAIDEIYFLARGGWLKISSDEMRSEREPERSVKTYRIESYEKPCDDDAPSAENMALCLPEDISGAHKDACLAAGEGRLGEYFDSLRKSRKAARDAENAKDAAVSPDETDATYAKPSDEIIENVWLPSGEDEKSADGEIMTEWRRYAKSDGAAGYDICHLDEYMELAKNGKLMKIRAFHDGLDAGGNPVAVVVPRERFGIAPQRILDAQERDRMAFKVDLEYLKARFSDDAGRRGGEISSPGPDSKASEAGNDGNETTDAPCSGSETGAGSKSVSKPGLHEGYEIGGKMVYGERKDDDYMFLWKTYAEHVSTLGHDRVSLKEYMARAKKSELVKVRVCLYAEEGREYEKSKYMAVPAEAAGDILVTEKQRLSPEEKSDILRDIMREFDDAERVAERAKNEAQSADRASAKAKYYDGK